MKIKRRILKEDLLDLSLTGLREMYDYNNKLFSDKILLPSGHLRSQGMSLRYSIIALMGLIKAKANGLHVGLDLQEIKTHLQEKLMEINSVGDLGLILWASALEDSKETRSILHSIVFPKIYLGFKDWKRKLTTELAWFLTGLSFAASYVTESYDIFLKIVYETYNALKYNCNPTTGLFRHLGQNSFTGVIRGNIGCFADQIYPIVALANFYAIFSKKEALNYATKCAEKICSLQGNKGQWWWHYEINSGRIIGRYPVYSVHQDGMAPMALFALSKVNGQDFTPYIYKGLEWVMGKNELEFNMIDVSRNLIWRSLFRKRYKMYYDSGLALLGCIKSSQNGLNINYECRSYHLGWILYAFADRRNI